MPGFNRTGPMGAGPMTGRIRGLCGFNRSQYRGELAQTFGRFRQGRGFRGGDQQRIGRSFLRRFFDLGSPYPERYSEEKSSELEWLKEQAESITTELETINKRIAELQKQSS